jgi:hypothetical protein
LTMRRVFGALTICTFLGMALVMTALALSRTPSAPVQAVVTPSPEPTTERTVDHWQTAMPLLLTAQPTATETPRPEVTRRPTMTPIPQCDEQNLQAGALCIWHTATPSRTPDPTWTPSPTIAPCPASPAVGDSPRFCWVIE